MSPAMEDDDRPITGMTLEEITRTIGDTYTGSQLPRYLRELKEFLSSKGLSLASASGPGGIVEPAAEEAPLVAEGPVSEETLKKNLSDFEWSGRIRKVFEKMSVVNVGDLLKRTEKDLLKSKNLGVTSIKEIRKKLGQLGVSMKPE